MSRSRLVACWVTTRLVASSMLSAGVAHVLHVQSERRRLRAPRLPAALRHARRAALSVGGYVGLAHVPDPPWARLQRRSQ